MGNQRERPNRIGLDISALDPDFKEHATRGIGRYVRGLRSGLASIAAHPPNKDSSNPNHSLLSRGTLLEVPAPSPRPHSTAMSRETIQLGAFDHHDFSLPLGVDGLIDRLPFGGQTVKQQLCFPVQLRSEAFRQFDLLHFPAHMDAPAWSPAPYAITVHDFIPLACRGLYEAQVGSWRFRLARSMEQRAIREARVIFANSQCTANDAIQFLGVPPERIVVTHLGVDEIFFSLPPEEVERKVRQRFFPPASESAEGAASGRRVGPVISYVGGIDARKNVPWLLTVFGEICRRRKTRNLPSPHLLLVGKIQDHPNFPALQKQIQILGIANAVRCTGYLADEDMRAIVHASDLSVFPSLYEGFGLPPLEALALGTPVLAAKTSCLPEILGDSVHWVDPKDTDGATSKLEGLLENEEHRKEYRDAGRQHARRFSWRATAEATLRGYQQFLR